ncbi:putative G-patch domain-containing protein [Seiridium cardinale]|uniref:G-patch domain-containing protein n=1 Tax=Seiridium cardinale TaxID=138064 RepID=A0ABR2X8X9_9PEZI
MASDNRYEEHEEEESEMPLHSKRAFGSGLYRKPIAFLPARSGGLASTNHTSTPSKSIADLYLNIVLSKDAESVSTTQDSTPTQMCEVCQLPMDEGATGAHPDKAGTRPHEATLAHQVCLEHSHPPSALDRSRMGLSVLQSQGWNPDSRKGLGAVEQGVQFPIKAREKRDTLGIGVKVPKNLDAYKKEKQQKLDAGKVRKMVAEDKKRRERLQRQFYGNGELEKYLGS